MWKIVRQKQTQMRVALGWADKSLPQSLHFPSFVASMTARMDINGIQDEIISEFEFLSDWEEKYNYIIELARDLAPYPAQYRDDAHKVRGCQSQVWLHAETQDGRLQLFADSDALIPKGLISLLLRVYNGQPAKDIANSPLYFIDKIGLSSNLSPTRSNGLASMVKRIQAVADVSR